MENKKDIGKAIREKLDGLDKSPSENLWDAIHADLQKKKKRRFIFIPFWFKISGLFMVAAVVFFMVSDLGSDSDKNGLRKHSETESIVSGNGDSGKASGNDDNNADVRKKGNPESTNDNRHPAENAANQNRIVLNGNSGDTNPTVRNSSNEKSATRNSFSKNNDPTDINVTNCRKAGKNRLALNKGKKSAKERKGKFAVGRTENKVSNSDNLNGNKPKNGLTENAGMTESKSKTDSSNTKPAKEIDLKKTDSLKIADKKRALKENSQDSVPQIIDAFQRLNIFVYAGPTFGGYLSNNSPLDKRLNRNQTSSETEITYGALVSYGATERWSLRFGLGITNLRFVTKSAEVNTTNYYNISYTKNISNLDIYTQADSPEKMDIIQDISYTEIPLELKYIISKRTIGFNAFGGLSYLFLNKNSVSVKTDNGRRFDIGETANLAGNTFTANLGVGFDYKFAKRVKFNVEPLFRYHLVDYKNAGGTRPYSMAVLAGFQFSLK